MRKTWFWVGALALLWACDDGGGDGGDAEAGIDGGGVDGGGVDANETCVPQAERCNGIDDDCDGAVDEAFEGLGTPCEIDGCATPGRLTCDAAGDGLDCAIEGVPEACDGLDNDCDGAIDEAVTSRCYPGPDGTQGVGACVVGALTCVGGTFGECRGAVVPSDEICNAIDDDCDGATDEGEGLCPVCGDGVVHPAEDCDDGNTDAGDGCDAECAFEPAANGVVLVCGDSARDPAAWLRPSDRVAVAAGCEPDDDTRAILVTESGFEAADPADLRRFVALGGNLVTAARTSHAVFAAVFQLEVAVGVRLEACGGRVHPATRQNPDDRVWEALGPNRDRTPAGCGFSLAGLTGITPLGGEGAEISLAYRHFGEGRVWLAEADWPAEGDPLDAGSAGLMRLMMLWRAGPRAPGVQQNMPVDLIEARGFRRCFTEGYEGRVPIDDVLRRCGGDDLLLGCRAAGEGLLRVAAEGQLAEVIHDVGADPLASHAHNQAQWYFNEATSWGFAPIGASVNRRSCDIDDLRSDRRMCWHVQDGRVQPGYRCGANPVFEADFERVIYVRGPGVALGADRGFGHHGAACEPQWNGCVDGPSCAQAACTFEGAGRALAWEESTCATRRAADPEFSCDLFDGSDVLDTGWEPGRCDVNVAHDVQCASPRRIELARGQGFGAPGDCDGFEGCADDAACAARACGEDSEPLGWRSGRCADLQARDPGFVCRMVDATGADQGPAPDDCNLAVVYDVDCAPAPLPSFDGIRLDMPIAEVRALGFRECWSDTYAGAATSLAEIDRLCGEGELLLGCTTDDAETLDAAAMGPRAVVAGETPLRGTVEANGVQWYRNGQQSWGFAPAGAMVNLETCDIEAQGDRARLCWHLAEGETRSGYRCGASVRLFEGGRRFVFHRPIQE